MKRDRFTENKAKMVVFRETQNTPFMNLSCNKTEENNKNMETVCFKLLLNGPRQANLVLITYASSEGSGEPAHPRSLARTFAARSYKQCQEEPSDRKPDPCS